MIIVETWNMLKKVGWFLPGFLLYAAYPPMCEVTDVLFALAPLMWLSRRSDPKTSAKRWFQSGLFFWVATLSWMPAIIDNGGPWPLVVLGWGALALYCCAYFAAYGWLSAAYWRWSSGRGTALRLLGILIVEPLLWCGLELIRSRFGGGFAWNQLGVVPANAGFGGPAALGGVYLLSAVVILINGSIAGIAERVIARIQASRRLPYDETALSRLRGLETLLVFVIVWGIYQVEVGRDDPIAPSTPTQAPSTLRVALIQRNFPCCFKTPDESPIEIYSNLFAKVSLLQPDFVVLSESAMSEFGLVDHSRALRFANWARQQLGGAALLAGGTRFEGNACYNSAALYQANRALQVYDKVHLVPFGEYIPGDKVLPILQKLAPVGSCTPGEAKVMDSAGVPFGTAICFEDTDSALIRSFAAKGARFLCFITNDSWFSKSNEALAHAWQATARACETGLPIVRVGNSGVSGVILPDGTRSWLLGTNGRALVDHAGTMVDQIVLPSASPTPYTALGDIPLALAFALLILSLILVKYSNKLKRIDNLI